MALKFFVLLGLLFAEASCASVNSGGITRATPKEKATAALNEIIKRACREIPELGLPSLDPFYLNDFNLRMNYEFGDFDLTLEKLIATNVKSIQLESFDFDRETLSIKFFVTIPLVNLEGIYSVKGNILGIDLNGAGDFTFQVTKIDVVVTSQMKVIDDQVRLGVLGVQPSIKGLKADMKGIFPDPALNAAFNAALTTIGPQLVEEVWEDAEEQVVEYIRPGLYSQSYIPGTLTVHKYQTLGTHEAIQQTRKSYMHSQQHHKSLAHSHMQRISAEAKCKWPKPRVERIQKEPSKMYTPHCTILHRCGDDTGCCAEDTMTCVAKRVENVDLYFFVNVLGAKQGAIERHSFINHTECHCVSKNRYQGGSGGGLQPPAAIRQATVLDCTCPKSFEKVLQDDGICRCDCSSGKSSCDWLKRGMEHFSMSDRKCIIEGRCKLPTCEYGTYVRRHGRCPKKEDKLAFSISYH